MYRMLLTLVALCWMPVTTAIAHPFHSTLAEMEWNSRSGLFEISLQFSGVEIEAELTSRHGLRVNLETTAGAEALLRDYVEQHYKLSDADHKSCRFRWVGMEVQVRCVWAYFEIELIAAAESRDAAAGSESTHGFKNLAVHCSLLAATRPNQINVVNLQTENEVASVHLTREQPEARMELRRKPSERPEFGRRPQK